MTRTPLNIAFALLLTSASVVTSLYLTKEHLQKDFKSMSLIELLKDENDSVYKKFVNGEIKEAEYEKLQAKKMQLIQEGIDKFTTDKTILLMDEMLVKSNTNSANIENITENVKKYVEQNLYNSEK